MIYRKLIKEASELKYDLNRWYNHWNQKLFDGELMDIDLKYANIKQLGIVKAYTVKTRGKVTRLDRIEYLAISNMYELPEPIFHATLIHEMIHVYMLQNHDEFRWTGGYHGREFRSLAREMSKRSGYDIVVQHDLHADELNVRGKGKQTIVTVVRTPRGKLAAWGLKPSAWDKNTREQLIDILERYYSEWSIWNTDAPDVRQLIRSRKIPKRINFTLVSQRSVDNFEKNGKQIASSSE